MGDAAEHVYFHICRALGRLLRSARYATAQIATQGDRRQVRKHRAFYAPLLLWPAGWLMRILDTGVRILQQREWAERERLVYASVHGSSIRIEKDGTLVLPCLAGRTLAALLEDQELDGSIRGRAVALALAGLSEFHRLGFTHGDAMAENVLIDLESGVARWFDFETVHDPNRSTAWRRADDLRALLATCLIRTAPEVHAATIRDVVDACPDVETADALRGSFGSVWRRSLTFHLAQAELSLRSFREIGRLLREQPDR